MKKVGIIGVGHVGSTTAYTLIQQQVADEIILYDKNEPLVVAEVNDLLQGQIGRDSTVKVRGNDLAELGSCDVLIFAAGDITLLAGDTDRFEELAFTKQVAAEWGPKIKDSGFNGILVSITNPCDVIVHYLQKLTGIPYHRIFGTGTSLDTVRMQQAVGESLNIHPNNVTGYVLGEHGETQFVPWSMVKIAQQPIDEIYSPTELEELEKETRQKGWKIFLGKVYTCYGIANQASKIVKAILTDAQIILPLSVFSETEQIYIGQPALLGKDGIVKTYPLVFTPNEVVKWQNSVDRIKEMSAAI